MNGIAVGVTNKSLHGSTPLCNPVPPYSSEDSKKLVRNQAALINV